MVVLIPSKREDGTLVFKLCIYGPSESGRKTVLEWIYGKENSSANSDGGRTCRSWENINFRLS